MMMMTMARNVSPERAGTEAEETTTADGSW